MKHTYSGRPALPWQHPYARYRDGSFNPDALPPAGMALPIETIDINVEPDVWRDAHGVIWHWCPQRGFFRADNPTRALAIIRHNRRLHDRRMAAVYGARP